MHYEKKVYFEAPPERVYEALTTEEGLQNWWTRECKVEDGEGSGITFRFGRSRVGIQVEAAEPNRKVEWRCIDHHFEGMSPEDEWLGTRISFRLAPASRGTELHFVHEGLVPELACWDACNAGWDRNLLTSLKQYVEAGKGEPYQEWIRRHGR